MTVVARLQAGHSFTIALAGHIGPVSQRLPARDRDNREPRECPRALGQRGRDGGPARAIAQACVARGGKGLAKVRRPFRRPSPPTEPHRKVARYETALLKYCSLRLRRKIDGGIAPVLEWPQDQSVFFVGCGSDIARRLRKPSHGRHIPTLRLREGSSCPVFGVSSSRPQIITS